MSARPSHTAARFNGFGTTIFAEMTRLAAEHNAINLSQGFPDFDGPDFVKKAATDALIAGRNQYARPLGEPELNQAIAAWWRRQTGRDADPNAEITVTAGCTEALAATFLGLINPGDEVILFEPFYDSYRACTAMAGGTPRFVALRPRHTGLDSGEAFGLDEAELRAAFNDKTRAIVINTPHNPTGKVFTRDELRLISELCAEHDTLAITDEVYERLVFDPTRPHIPPATLPGMAERTITLSSLGKTFSVTGWKIGWAIAPPELTAAVRMAHQYLTFAIATPLQHGAAAALTDGEPYVAQLLEDYRAKRDFLATALQDIGFGVHQPDGTYFIMADHTPFGFEDDVAFCRHLIERLGVAAIPPSAFYSRPELGKSLVRFAFCKQQHTLEAAVERLAPLARG